MIDFNDFDKAVSQISGYEFNGYRIPEYMAGGMARYLLQGIPSGDFLTAVLENNLMEAIGRADQENMRNLPAYVSFLYNETPSNCFGSHKIVNEWIKTRG